MAQSPSVRENLRFEEILPWFSINGAVTLSEGRSTEEFPEGMVARIIQADQPVKIRFKWRTAGLLVPFLAGTWKVTVFFEKMGGDEFTLPNNVAQTSFVGRNPHHYSLTLDIAPNTLPGGVYKVVASLNFCAPDGTPGPVAAFTELGMVQVYSA